jgi:hypothetical protein
MWEGEQLKKLDPVELYQCQEVLEGAIKHGLLIEVLEAAFQYKEQEPEASLVECLLEGAMEWDL